MEPVLCHVMSESAVTEAEPDSLNDVEPGVTIDAHILSCIKAEEVKSGSSVHEAVVTGSEREEDVDLPHVELPSAGRDSLLGKIRADLAPREECMSMKSKLNCDTETMQHVIDSGVEDMSDENVANDAVEIGWIPRRRPPRARWKPSFERMCVQAR